jgi:hypothetical protein
MSNAKILKDYLINYQADGLKEITIAPAATTLAPFIE